MRALPDVLHPRHGTVLMNLHGGPMPSLGRQLISWATGGPYAGAGFDPAGSSQGAEVVRMTRLYRYAWIGCLPCLPRQGVHSQRSDCASLQGARAGELCWLFPTHRHSVRRQGAAPGECGAGRQQRPAAGRRSWGRSFRGCSTDCQSYHDIVRCRQAGQQLPVADGRPGTMMHPSIDRGALWRLFNSPTVQNDRAA